MAVFAGDAFGQFERAAALLWRCVQRMARKALRRFFGFLVEFQNAGDAFADFSSQRLICMAMLVFYDPGRIFILQNAASGNGFDATVATRGGARAWADVFYGLAVRISRFGGSRCSRFDGIGGSISGNGICWLGRAVFRCGHSNCQG